LSAERPDERAGNQRRISMRHSHSNDYHPLHASADFDSAAWNEFGFDPVEDDFLDRHLAAIRDSLSDFRNQ
jgi:hypothetical protein